MIKVQKGKTNVKEFLQNKKDNTSLCNKKNQLDTNTTEDVFSRSILSNSAQMNLKMNLSQMANPKITSS